MKFKHNYEKEVFDFGLKSFHNNINKLGIYEEGGSINSYRGVEDGGCIILRLGDTDDLKSMKSLVEVKLKQMSTDMDNYKSSEDRSAQSYLDNERRIKDIALLESFLIRLEDVNNMVKI